MQVVAKLGDVPFTERRAVIINCGTKWVTSLALVSALANTDCPVLVIDCESRDGSRAHFEWLAHNYALHFHWLTWPVRSHPAALNALFCEIRSNIVLLVDSDLEIRNDRVFRAMKTALAENEDAYGAGFVHGPEWMGPEHGLPPYCGYYAERMWIPFVLLRTELVRNALQTGFSFEARRPFLEIPNMPKLSRLIGYRYRVRGLCRLRLPTSRHRGGTEPSEFEGRRPAFVEYDTGADLHRGLQSSGHRFVRLPDERWADVYHHHGVTRANVAGFVRRAGKRLRLTPTSTETQQRPVLADIKARLTEIYGIRAIDSEI